MSTVNALLVMAVYVCMACGCLRSSPRSNNVLGVQEAKGALSGTQGNRDDSWASSRNPRP